MANHSKKPIYLITAGGTGGHMYPALAMAQKLSENGFNVHLITDSRGIKYVSNAPALTTHILPLTGLGKQGKINQCIGFITMIPALFMCLYCLFAFRPKYVIGFGGYPSFPCLLASWMLRIPIWLQEQNAHIGRVNKWFSPVAQGIAMGFAKTKGLTAAAVRKAHVVGIPVRQEIHNVRHTPFMPEQGKLKIMVLGGSQGARIFSDVLPAAIEKMTEKERACLAIVQQCRPEDQARVVQTYKRLRVAHTIRSFIDNISQELEDTGLLIARSGASTTGEVIASARPALFVPLPIATDDHQYHNAEAIARYGGVWVKREKDFSPEAVASFLRKCLENPSLLQHAHASLMSLEKQEPVNLLYELMNGSSS